MPQNISQEEFLHIYKTMNYLENSNPRKYQMDDSKAQDITVHTLYLREPLRAVATLSKIGFANRFFYMENEVKDG